MYRIIISLVYRSSATSENCKEDDGKKFSKVFFGQRKFSSGLENFYFFGHLKKKKYGNTCFLEVLKERVECEKSKFFEARKTCRYYY